MPSLTDNNMLQPSNIYISNCDCYPVVYAVLDDEDILWAQPLVIMQNRYPSPMLNAWDGEFEINEDAGTILSTMVGAGKKEDDNSFSGVLMGEVSIAQAEVGKNDVFSTNHDGLGLYGFHHGAQSFGFNIAGRIVDKRDAMLLHDPEIVVGRPYAMSCIGAMFQQTCVGEIRHGRLSVTCNALLMFFPGLRHVYMERTFQFPVCGSEFAAESGIGKVLRMDARIRHDTLVR